MWTSQTRQFPPHEMAMLEQYPANELGPALAGTPPVVALRALAEVMLNGDDAKLDALLANTELTANWQQFETDTGVDDRDHGYAKQLRARLPQ